MLIAPSAPTILRRTVALSANAGRIERHLACRRAFFDDDYMFPVVAEVVGVDEAGEPDFNRLFRVSRFSLATSSAVWRSPYCRPPISKAWRWSSCQPIVAWIA